jgi:hypothetical protein
VLPVLHDAGTLISLFLSFLPIFLFIYPSPDINFFFSRVQVKQKKKSSNKWTCVVCNQKQSVRKVFAQGCLAKDLRKFVQSFNMSRKIADEQDSLDQDAVLIPTSETDHIGLNENCQRKRRSDWTEYLDAEEEYNIKQEDEGTCTCFFLSVIVLILIN